MINVVLPPREGYNPNKFGAISLSVLEFVKSSSMIEQIEVLGGDNCNAPFTERYAVLPAQRSIFSSSTSNYLKNIVNRVKASGTRLLEVHNRPYYISFLKRFTDAKITLHLHNDPLEMKGSKTVKQRKYLLDNCEYIYCVSDYIRKRFITGLDASDTSRVVVIYNNPQLTGSEVVPQKSNKVLYVGRLSNDKGVLELVEAYRRIMPLYPKWEFCIVAKIIGHPREFPFLKKIKTLERFPNFKFMYNISNAETIKHFSEAAIAVLPSKWPEPFGRVVLESIANGCATITSNYGGIPEIIGDAGVMLNRLTDDSIAIALNNLISDETIRHWFQQSAIKRCAEFHKVVQEQRSLDQYRARLIAD